MTSKTSEFTTTAPSITRRAVLGSVAGTAIASALPRPTIAQTGRSLTFAFAPDDSGAIQQLLDGFAAETGIAVNWRRMDRLTDSYFREMQSDFIAGAEDIDVFGADVVWTAELAAEERILDLGGLSQAPQGTYVPAALRSTVYRNRSYAVPWYTDAGLLYYRRDLLDGAGLTPPRTWTELAQHARAIMDTTGTAHGFVFQGDAYEGGVTNMMEFIWSAGGRPWTGQVSVPGALSMGQATRDPNVVTLNSPDTIQGLTTARALVAEGIAPPDVTDMRELEALDRFAAGDAVFMRNWPFAFGAMRARGMDASQIGVAPIPTLSNERESYSCLGGWNLAVPATAQNRSAALDFIAYATRPDSQRMMAEVGGFLPVLSSLYTDETLREAAPVVAVGETAVANARARPASPIYSLLSPRLAFMFEDVLSGERDPAIAVERTETELRRILRQYDI